MVTDVASAATIVPTPLRPCSPVAAWSAAACLAASAGEVEAVSGADFGDVIGGLSPPAGSAASAVAQVGSGVEAATVVAAVGCDEGVDGAAAGTIELCGVRAPTTTSVAIDAAPVTAASVTRRARRRER